MASALGPFYTSQAAQAAQGGYDEEGDQEDDEGAGLDPRPGAAVHGEDAAKTVALEGLRSN
jgi:hypothetical protein